MNRHFSFLIHSGLMVAALLSFRPIGITSNSAGTMPVEMDRSLEAEAVLVIDNAEADRVDGSIDGLAVFGGDRGLPNYRGGGGTR